MEFASPVVPFFLQSLAVSRFPDVPPDLHPMFPGNSVVGVRHGSSGPFYLPLPIPISIHLIGALISCAPEEPGHHLPSVIPALQEVSCLGQPVKGSCSGCFQTPEVTISVSTASAFGPGERGPRGTLEPSGPGAARKDFVRQFPGIAGKGREGCELMNPRWNHLVLEYEDLPQVP